MIPERILALDISSKTGWCLIVSSDDGAELEDYGVVPQIHEPKDEPYPGSYVSWAYQCFGKISELIERLHPDVLAIEETAANSKSSHSQKILEFTHFLVAKLIKETGIKNTYFMTGQWRSLVDCKMTKEEKLHNKEVAAYKEKNNTKIAYGKDGKRIGKIGKKHVAIRRANEVFGKYLTEPLRRKNEDEADALCLGLACHLRRLKMEKPI